MRNFFYPALLAGALLIQSSAALSGVPIVYVDASATGANDGTSWADAYTDLQDALNADNTPAPAQLWLAAGVYKPVVPQTYGSPTGGERGRSFIPRSGITIYGGFSGVESSLEQRDWEANRSVLSGDIANSSTTDAQGIVQHPNDLGGGNSYHVVYANSQTFASAILDGVVITGGWADNTYQTCTSSFGYHSRHGGGVYSDNGQPVFHNVLIIGNKARCYGGGVYNTSGGRLKFENVTIRYNEAERGGGGLYSRDLGSSSGSSLELSHTVISDNQGSFGAGIYVTAHADLNNVDVSRNHSSGSGGGIYFSGVEMNLHNVTLQANHSGGYGGAVYFTNSGQMHFDNALLAGNQAQQGGGIYRSNLNSSMNLRNVAIVSNRASTTAGGIVGTNSNVQISNSIIYANLLGSQLDLPASSLTGVPIVQHSLIQGHSPDGPGNFDCAESCPDPRFEDLLDATLAPSVSGNFRLRTGSPAIDAGDNALVTVDFDLDGALRIQNGRVDLGPYETTGPLFHDRFEQY